MMLEDGNVLKLTIGNSKRFLVTGGELRHGC